MSSQRTRASECCNDEGKQSHHLADGLTYLLRDGGEYRDIFPVWDWRRLPGTTAVQAPGALDPAGVGGRGEKTFVGGVSDGEYGLAVMELGRGGLRARKSWFYFDESFVCLGTGIGCDNEAGPVFTSLNQCLLRGLVTAYGKGGETHVLAPGKSFDLSAANRLETRRDRVPLPNADAGAGARGGADRQLGGDWHRLSGAGDVRRVLCLGGPRDAAEP